MKQLKGKDLKFGDLVIIDDRRKTNVLGSIIRFVEYGGKHPFDRFMGNHVGFVVEENEKLNKVKIWDASMSGVKITPLKIWMKNPKTNIEVRRYKKSITDNQKNRFNKWFEEKKGLGYDYGALVGILARYCVMGLIKNRILKMLVKFFFGKNPLQSKLRFYCSELYYASFKEVLRVLLWKESDPSFITPYDLQKSKKMTTIGKWYQFEYAIL